MPLIKGNSDEGFSHLFKQWLNDGWSLEGSFFWGGKGEFNLTIFFVKLFETSFGSNLIPSFTEFQCQGTDTFGSIQEKTFEVHIQDNFLHK